jgi:cation diffusion facilitator CzcD-associated flavoprotein CzcO
MDEQQLGNPEAVGQPHTGGPGEREVEVLVVGAGLAGIGAGVMLRDAGFPDFVIIDRADEFGGTWYANTYPGVACDIPSQVYSYRAAPYTEWSMVFAPGAEIQRYLLGVVERHGLRDHASLRTEMLAARWDDPDARWTVQTTSGTYRARFMIVGTGVLEDPRVPDIPGLTEFPGRVFHTARWPKEDDLAGERVAVVGTGASAIQVVPEIQPRVSRLSLFQRTPAWVLPKPDLTHGRLFRAGVRRWPLLRRLMRGAEWVGVELFLKSLFSVRVSNLVARVAKYNIRRSIPDPVLRAKLTPDYVLGCKRALLSNTYYRALAQPNVEVIASGLVAVEGSELVAVDGTRCAVDSIVLATGFHFVDPPVYRLIHQRDGRTVAQRWDGRPEAYLGTAIAGCPNMLVISGPNGSTASVFAGVDATLDYIREALVTVRERGLLTFEVRPEVARAWKAETNRYLAGSMHSVGGCSNQYTDRDNNNVTLFPASMSGMRRRLSRFDMENYDVRTLESQRSPERSPLANADVHGAGT